MLINGEKFACEACVRGHRVSSCQHSDRPLIHVNKKGRPISQCHHCRGLRKSRASHVKCECAEKAHTKEDCPHDKGEKSDGHTCCCGHGARCSCSLKKEHLDTVPEDVPQIIHPLLQPRDPPKHRISSLNSHDTRTTIFTNGHHKPVHKINDAHNHCGAPYRVPHKNHPLHNTREMAQRSSDSLPLTKLGSGSHEVSPLHESITSTPQPVRQVKSEHGSPELRALLDGSEYQGLTMPAIDPRAFTESPLDSNSPSYPQNTTPDHPFPEQFPDDIFMSYEQAHQYQPPFPSGGLSEGLPEIDWSMYNFQNASNGFNANSTGFVRSQAPSYTSYEQLSHLSQPGLASSSGEISEADDVQQSTRPQNLRADSQDASNDISSNGGDEISDSYRLSSASSYFGMPQAQMLATNNLESLDIDDYLKQAAMENRQARLQSIQQQPPYQPPAFRQPSEVSEAEVHQGFSPNSHPPGEHPFTIQEAQNMAHLTGVAESRKVEYTPPTLTEDPMWSCPQTPGGTNLNFEDDDDEWPNEPQ